MTEPSRTEVDRFVRVTQIIAAAVALAIPIYVVVAWIVAPTMPVASDNGQLITIMAVVLGALSIGQLAAAQLLVSTRMRGLTKLDDAGQRLVGYRTTVIIAFALRESIAIFGLVLSLLGGDPRWALGFGAVALLSMLLGWPRRSAMERLAATVPPIG